MHEPIMKCPLCALALSGSAEPDPVTGEYDLCCSTCWSYRICAAAIDALPKNGREPLCCAARQASKGPSIGEGGLVITPEVVPHLIKQYSSSTIERNVEKLLRYIVRQCPRPGQAIRINPDHDWPIIDVRNRSELEWYVKTAKEDLGLILKAGQGERDVSLTAKGWQRVLSGPGDGFIPGRCFVAMSFDAQRTSIFTECIKPAAKAAGYDAFRMDGLDFNGDVCDRMLAEIRQAEIVVADFTGNKHGVYFEAGFALALGREVYWTVHKDDTGSLHFDTNHYQHLVWEDPADLRKRLSDKIMAVSGPGPYFEREEGSDPTRR